MNSAISYEKFPFWIVVLSSTHSILIYLSGIFVLYQLVWYAALLYALMITGLEYRLIRHHCINCYYWGKTCGFAKGRLSALLFKKGEPSLFCAKKFTWYDMIPDILVVFVPVLVGIILLFIKFSILILIGILLLFTLSTFGNSYIRGKLTCYYCKQKELGCPANDLFKERKAS